MPLGLNTVAPGLYVTSNTTYSKKHPSATAVGRPPGMSESHTGVRDATL